MTNNELKKLIAKCDDAIPHFEEVYAKNEYEEVDDEVLEIYKKARELAHMTLKFRGAEQ